MVLEITYIDTNYKERVIVAKTKCLISGSPGGDYHIDLQDLSQDQFELEWNDKDFFITDLDSLHGIYVNGERIPHGEKTLFQNFFSIEINGQVSVSVFHDDIETPVSPVSPRKIRTQEKTNRGRNKARVTDQVRPKARQKKADNSRSQNLIKVIGFAFVLLGVGHYLYKSQIQNELVPTQLGNQEKQSTGPEVLVSREELKAQLGLNSCQELGDVCSVLKLTHPHEKIVKSGDKLIIYVHSQAQIEKLNSSYMASFSQLEQVEYILGSFAFHPRIIDLAKKNSCKQVIGVGIESVDDLVWIKTGLSIDASKVPELDEENYQRLFSNLFFAGFYRPYKTVLKPFSRLKVY